jgi:hypothetical protein
MGKRQSAGGEEKINLEFVNTKNASSCQKRECYKDVKEVEALN